MQKIAINKCYGGFSLSPAGIYAYARIKGITLYEDNQYKYLTLHYTEPADPETGKFPDESHFSDRDLERDDPVLIQVIEELCSEANGAHANIGIVEIPDDVEWHIEEYDGTEWVAENHRTWS